LRFGFKGQHNLIEPDGKIPKEDINFGVPYNKQSTRSVDSVSVAYRWNTYVTVM
jgi:hypothetical protein